MPDLSVLASAAGAMLPAGVALGRADPRQLHPLLPGEDASAMVPKRRAEFSAGRHAARMALAGLGIGETAIPQGADRAPLWPGGVRGSITHSDSACLAAVSLSLRGLGLDLEPSRAMDPDLIPLIANPGDRLEDAPQADPALLLFSAREAAFKAQYPLSRRILGPESIAVGVLGARFTARLLHDAGALPAGQQIAGRIALVEGHVLATAWL